MWWKGANMFNLFKKKELKPFDKLKRGMLNHDEAMEVLRDEVIGISLSVLCDNINAYNNLRHEIEDDCLVQYDDSIFGNPHVIGEDMVCTDHMQTTGYIHNYELDYHSRIDLLNNAFMLIGIYDEIAEKQNFSEKGKKLYNRLLGMVTDEAIKTVVADDYESRESKNISFGAVLGSVKDGPFMSAVANPVKAVREIFGAVYLARKKNYRNMRELKLTGTYKPNHQLLDEFGAIIGDNGERMEGPGGIYSPHFEMVTRIPDYEKMYNMLNVVPYFAPRYVIEPTYSIYDRDEADKDVKFVKPETFIDEIERPFYERAKKFSFYICDDYYPDKVLYFINHNDKKPAIYIDNPYSLSDLERDENGFVISEKEISPTL